jgi:hypothetical protein
MEMWLERWCEEQAIALIGKILTSLSTREAIILNPLMLPDNREG